MNYEEAKQLQDKLYAESKRYSTILNSFPKGPMGMTPDDVKASPEWQEAKQGYAIAADRLRKFNQKFNSVFKNEIAADRRSRKPVQESKLTFIEFLSEAEEGLNGVPSFYNLYVTPFPSDKVKKMKDGKKKDEAKVKDQEDYQKLLTDFLQHTGIMNK